MPHPRRLTEWSVKIIISSACLLWLPIPCHHPIDGAHLQAPKRHTICEWEEERKKKSKNSEEEDKSRTTVHRSSSSRDSSRSCNRHRQNCTRIMIHTRSFNDRTKHMIKIGETTTGSSSSIKRIRSKCMIIRRESPCVYALAAGARYCIWCVRICICPQNIIKFLNLQSISIVCKRRSTSAGCSPETQAQPDSFNSFTALLATRDERRNELNELPAKRTEKKKWKTWNRSWRHAHEPLSDDCMKTARAHMIIISRALWYSF